eukprot:2991043-Lingulodinium_polyedra.AAC.1
MISAVAEPRQAVARILAVGVQYDRARNRGERRQGGVELAALRRLLAVDRAGPRPATLAGHHDSPSRPREQRVQRVGTCPV